MDHARSGNDEADGRDRREENGRQGDGRQNKGEHKGRIHPGQLEYALDLRRTQVTVASNLPVPKSHESVEDSLA